jgi:hypothetical protein
MSVSTAWSQAPASSAKGGERIAFDGDVKSLAAKSPDAVVNTRTIFKEGVTAEQVSQLVTAEKIPAISVIVHQPRSAQSYYSFGYSFSASEPNMPEQLARARCQEQFPAVVNMKPEELDSIGTVMLSAAQAYQWTITPPAIVKRSTVTAVLTDKQIARAKEIMHKLLTARLPSTSDKPVSAECQRFMQTR